MFIKKVFYSVLNGLAISASLISPVSTYAGNLNLAETPLFLGGNTAPLTMLVMGRNHKLYFEAYNDASDIDGDGLINDKDLKYNPDLERGYYGYFESNLCYEYDTSGNVGVYVPKELASDKRTCQGSAPWSGDFLNYVTTSRIDALRKVLYGGSRLIDTASRTVLRRAYIPQDAHVWGKEYTSVAIDGYNIEDYTDLSLPRAGRRHILANMSLSDVSDSTSLINGAQPLMRVMKDTPFRVWQWLSIERPVGDTQCFDNSNIRVDCVGTPPPLSGTPTRDVVPGQFIDAVRTTYDLRNQGGNHPNNHQQYDNFIATFTNPDLNNLDGSGPISQIDGSGNPFGNNDRYLTIIDGKISIPVDGEYTFYVDGDDAVEFNLFNSSGGDIMVVGFYGGHGRCNNNCNQFSGTATLSAGEYDFEFRHEELGGGDSYTLEWLPPEVLDNTSLLAEVTNYDVNIEVCNKDVSENVLGGENLGSCKAYSDGSGVVNYKPAGILQDKGETDEMMFGLITGSYENNLEGGVLRKQMGTLTDEIDLTTGIFDPNVVGVIKTIDNLRVWGFNYSDGSKKHHYLRDAINGRPSRRECTFNTDDKLVNGDCNMWGNPIGEMMYEAMRYFAGSGEPTQSFEYENAGSIDQSLNLPQPDWNKPYDPQDPNSFDYCATPYQLVISDINPSYDSNTIPGAYTGFGGGVTEENENIKSFNFETEANDISALEGISGNRVYIGHSDTDESSAPTAKVMTGLGRVRGLSPEEPTKEGSYSAAAVAYFARNNDLSQDIAEPPEFSADRNSSYKQLMRTFSIALASPLPEIRIPVANDQFITILPFAKTVIDAGSLPVNFGLNALENQRDAFQATNQIVDFYIQELTDTNGTFLINFEDVESGGDHDMDAIARYSYELLGDGTVRVDVESIFAGGGATQHMGYVISGTSRDGIYLEVRDIPEDNESDKRYYLDTPDDVDAPPESLRPAIGQDPRGNTLLSSSVPASRIFTPEVLVNAPTFLRGPLWYAAKYGGFEEADNTALMPGEDPLKRLDGIPNLRNEWAANADVTDDDPDPDNYFLVTNPLNLEEQLNDAFDFPQAQSAAATVTVSAGSLGSDTLLFQATFDSSDWSGEVKGISLDSQTGVLANDAAWLASERINEQFVTGTQARQVLSFNTQERKGVPFTWTIPTSSTEDTLTQEQLTELITDIAPGDEQKFVDYIRGDVSSEGSENGTFRERASLLGDIVHSNPVYVPRPGFFYSDTWVNIGGITAPENLALAQQYSDFRGQLRNRNPMVYFGANDGIFHGIRATSDTEGGKEVLAYVPTPVFSDLSALTDQDYQHQYYVDGPANFGDAFFDETDQKWHTVLVGSLRGGGQGIFALDITDPEGIVQSDKGFTEANAESVVLWEFTDSDSDPSDTVIDGDSDLGFTFGKPLVVRMASGRWAAVFGNGYNNTVSDGSPSGSGNAAIYIVDIEDGSLIKKLETHVGLADDPSGLDRPNGIAHVSAIDSNRDNTADILYAGDLFGNVWKFDVSSANEADWGSAFGPDSNPTPLYVTESVSGDSLPITTQIQVGLHPDAEFRNVPGNFMLFFGTGQYIESTDNATTGQSTQSFHGLWDDSNSVINGPGNLQRQFIQDQPVHPSETATFALRTSTDNPIDWDSQRGWIVDILSNTGVNGGERQVSDAVLRNGRIVFTTLIPGDDLCQAGGTGWVMELDAANGGSIDNVSPFDIDGDGLINNADLDFNGDGVSDEPVVGIFVSTGIPSSPTIIDLPPIDDNTIIDNTGGSDGGSDDGSDDGSDGGTGGGTGEAPGGPDQTTEIKLIGESGGEVLRVEESGDRSITGRQSWREVR